MAEPAYATAEDLAKLSDTVTKMAAGLVEVTEVLEILVKDDKRQRTALMTVIDGMTLTNQACILLLDRVKKLEA